MFDSQWGTYKISTYITTVIIVDLWATYEIICEGDGNGYG